MMTFFSKRAVIYVSEDAADDDFNPQDKTASKPPQSMI